MSVDKVRDYCGKTEWEQHFREASGIKHRDRAVGYTLATYADYKTGENIRPGLQGIAGRWESDRGELSKAVKSLCKLGWIELVEDRSAKPTSSPNMYRLAIPEGAPVIGAPGFD